MSVVPATEQLTGHRRIRDWLGDRIMFGLTLLAALATVGIMALIAYKVVRGADLSLRAFGLSFVWDSVWDTRTNHEVYGAGQFLFGTAVTSLIALLIATPLAIAIALFLSELAPRSVRVIVGALVELLAAIPSVVLGLWGILVLGPFAASHIEPALNSTLGFLPIFGKPGSSGIFIAGLVLAIMVVPIVASICRELFLSVPSELEEAALALGSTRWEMVRGVVLSSSKAGIGAAVILGLGRAIGEAIAVTQVIGAGNSGIHISIFATGDTLASRIAGQFIGATSRLQIASLFYLAAILLVIGLLTNLLAQVVVRRFEFQRVGAD